MTDQHTIQQVGAQFVKAWNAHDMAALAGLFLPDADFVNVFGEWWTDRARIEKEHAAVHATVFRESRLTAQEMRVKSLSDDIASLHMRWALEGLHTPTGAALPDRRGILAFILSRKSGVWQIAVAQNTDCVPRP